MYASFVSGARHVTVCTARKRERACRWENVVSEKVYLNLEGPQHT